MSCGITTIVYLLYQRYREKFSEIYISEQNLLDIRKKSNLIWLLNVILSDYS